MGDADADGAVDLCKSCLSSAFWSGKTGMVTLCAPGDSGCLEGSGRVTPRWAAKFGIVLARLSSASVFFLCRRPPNQTSPSRPPSMISTAIIQRNIRPSSEGGSPKSVRLRGPRPLGGPVPPVAAHVLSRKGLPNCTEGFRRLRPWVVLQSRIERLGGT